MAIYKRQQFLCRASFAVLIPEPQLEDRRSTLLFGQPPTRSESFPGDTTCKLIRTWKARCPRPTQCWSARSPISPDETNEREYPFHVLVSNVKSYEVTSVSRSRQLVQILDGFKVCRREARSGRIADVCRGAGAQQESVSGILCSHVFQGVVQNQ